MGPGASRVDHAGRQNCLMEGIGGSGPHGTGQFENSLRGGGTLRGGVTLRGDGVKANGMMSKCIPSILPLPSLRPFWYMPLLLRPIPCLCCQTWYILGVPDQPCPGPGSVLAARRPISSPYVVSAVFNTFIQQSQREGLICIFHKNKSTKRRGGVPSAEIQY